MKVLLANDTGQVAHAGCQAVSDGHARLLGRAGHQVIHRVFRNELKIHAAVEDEQIIRNIESDEPLMAKVASADAVVVNGEGTIHHGAGRDLLGLLAAAQRAGKPTLLVNAVFQEVEGFDDTLRRLDDFVVREPRSQAYAASRGFTARVVPDSYFAARFDSPGIDGYAGRDVITDFHPARTDVAAVLRAYAEEQGAQSLPLRGAETMQTWSSLPETIRRSRALITGRHHGICLAIVARVPFVALGSNTYKIEGMLEMLGLERLYCETLEEVYAARTYAEERADTFAHLLERVTGGEPLSTFRALGRGGPDREAAEVQRLREDVGEVVH
jgi:polysaccharide pyruvyl transferase WcaK-like protein